jgi:signal transduction histidine kinase
MKTHSTESVEKELNMAKDIINQFINSCSHNLKEPLTSIEGLVMIAEHGTGLHETKQCLKLIKHCAAKMSDMIRSLEEYTITLKRQLQQDEIEAEQLVERVLDEYVEKIDRDKILISTKIAQPHKWIADEHCHYLILKNLISNAVQFSNPERKVKEIEVKVGVEADHVDVEISDNGIGIPEQEQHKIFRPFHRGSTKTKGSGLGLFLVKGLIEKLKASVSVSSAENIGTTVSISIPNNSTP